MNANMTILIWWWHLEGKAVLSQMLGVGWKKLINRKEKKKSKTVAFLYETVKYLNLKLCTHLVFCSLETVAWICFRP